MSGMRQYQFLKQVAALASPGEQLFVSGEWQGSPSKPIPFEDWPWQRARCSFRTILQREVLFDFDQPTWEEVRTEVLKLEQRLQAVGCPYYMWNTGGKGWHVNVYLNADDVDSVTSYKQLRVKFWEWATHLGAIADRIKVNWGTFSVVRTEGAIRRQRPTSIDELFRFRSVTKAYFDSIPLNRPIPMRDLFPEQLVTYQPPLPFLLTLDNENGLGNCPFCPIRLSQTSVSYDDWDDRIESVSCAICRSRQHDLVKRYPLEGEWVNAMPLDWLP